MNLRILHVLESCGAGGIETTFLNMLRVWKRDSAWAAHDVLALAGGPLEGFYRDAADSVTISAVPSELEATLLRRYDVIHFLFERCAYRLLPFVIAHNGSAVVCGKGYDMGGRFRTNDGLAWQPDESLLWGADRVTFTTADLASAYDVPANRSNVLGKAADVSPFLALPLAFALAPRRVVCVANLHVLKRLGDLIAAVARLRQDMPDVCVRFVGADPAGEGARLRALAREVGIEDACEFVGLRTTTADVADDIAASRVFALPSGCEGVPTAMLEAMAAARPVVMTDVGHIRGVIADGVEGFLVAAGDIDALVNSLRTLLTDRDLAETMGTAARARARHHDVNAIAARLRAVLEHAAADVARHEAAA